jgi:truncated hemoglobin YjbI
MAVNLVLDYYKIHDFREWIGLCQQACKTGKPMSEVRERLLTAIAARAATTTQLHCKSSYI